MACDPSDLQFGCSPSDIASDYATKAAMSAWEAVCKSFTDAAVGFLKEFAEAFVAFPTVDLSSGGIQGVYGLSLGIAALVGVILFLVQVARTVITHDGSGLAQGAIGIGKAALAFMTTLTVAGTALLVADELSAFIIKQTFGSTEGLKHKLELIFSWNPTTISSLFFLFAVVGIVLVAILWFQLLLRNAAVAALIATSPIAAAGMTSDATKGWWPKLVSTTVHLIVLKPAIALVFAIGFGTTGNSQSEDLGTLMTGMMILVLAVLAWPAIARFFAFTSVTSGSGGGLASVLAFAVSQASVATSGGGSGGGGGSSPVGVDPDGFGQAAESRTMASFGARSGGTAASGGGSSGGASGAAGAAGAAAVVPMIAAKGLELAQRAANGLVNGMDQMASHGGLGSPGGGYPAGNPNTIPYHRDVPTAEQSHEAAEPPESMSAGSVGIEPVSTAGPHEKDPEPLADDSEEGARRDDLVGAVTDPDVLRLAAGTGSVPVRHVWAAGRDGRARRSGGGVAAGYVEPAGRCRHVADRRGPGCAGVAARRWADD